MSVYEIDCGTGEAAERPLTPEELAALAAAQDEGAAAAEDAAWEAFYTERGLRLTGTDWMIEPWHSDLPDNVQDEIRRYETEWAAYRQALRDLPETVDPFAPVWPDPPPAPLLPVAPQPQALAARKRRVS